MAVFDASVVVKWYVADPLAMASLAARAQFAQAIAPAILTAEVANAFRRYVVAGEIDQGSAAAALEMITELVDIEPLDPLMPQAFALGCANNHSVHDCFYVSLAIQRAQPLITADMRLARKFTNMPGLDLRPLAPA